MADRPVRFGIAGAGHMGARHAACLRASPEATLAGVWSRTVEHAALLAADNQAQVYPTLQEMVCDPGLDAVIIATPPGHHAEAALAAIRAGKHAIVEKPLARTMADAELMLREAERAGVHLLTGHVVRFFPAFRALHDQVVSGTIGQPAVIHMSRETATPLSGWRADMAEGGGVILDLGIHEFDWLLWTLGPISRVYSRALSRSGRGADDYALATLRFESGAIAEVESSALRAGGFRTYGEIAGDQGLVTYDSELDQALTVDTDAPGRAVWQGLPTSYAGRSPYVQQLEHWVRCIRGQEEPEVGPDQACAALRVALAALESAECGKAVTL